jgi:hypothetical protein
VKAFISCTIVLFIAAAVGFNAAAEEKQPAKAAPKNAGYEKIKALAGDWEVTKGPKEHGLHGGTVSFKPTAGGSAVLETMFAGTEHEMVTLYYVDGDDLVLTHFCMLHNRPYMRAERGGADKIVFKCTEAENAKIAKDLHMHQATYTFVDADHIKTEWVLFKDGKADMTSSFELTRKKK